MRGVAFDELTTDYVASLGRAAAAVLGGGEWLIGRDTRESGPALEQALIDGLRAGRAEPLRTGVLPTPALAYLSARHQVPAAMITASHNPYRDNGVKIFAVGGLKLTDDVERAIESALSEPRPPASGDPGPSAVDVDRRVLRLRGSGMFATARSRGCGSCSTAPTGRCTKRHLVS